MVPEVGFSHGVSLSLFEFLGLDYRDWGALAFAGSYSLEPVLVVGCQQRDSAKADLGLLGDSGIRSGCLFRLWDLVRGQRGLEWGYLAAGGSGFLLGDLGRVAPAVGGGVVAEFGAGFNPAAGSESHGG